MTQREDGQWRALSNEKFFENKMLIGQVYRNELAKNLKDLGYEVQSDNKGLFEIRGIDQKLIDHFSQRAEQIQDKMQELRDSGMYPNADASKLREIAALGSRVAKQDVDMQTVRESWQQRLQEQGYTRESIQQSIQNASEQAKQAEANRAEPRMNEYDYIRTAAQIQTERESTFSREDILKTAGKLSVGEYRISELEKAFTELNHDKEIKTLDKGIYTTAEMQKIEKDIVLKVQKGHDAMNAIASKEQVEAGIQNFETSKGITMTQGQKEAVSHILTSQDRFTGIQGDAGTGKTTMLSAVREMAEKQGYHVRGLGFTGKAAAEVEQQAGIKSQTIDSFLAKGVNLKPDPSMTYSTDGTMTYTTHGNRMDSTIISRPGGEMQTIQYVHSERDYIQQGREVWVVDEASMVGSQKMHDLMNAAEKADARVVLIGDTKQLQAVEAGKMFSHLQKTGDLRTVRMSEVQRQKEASYRETVRDMAEKRIDRAFERLENKNRISEISDRQERLEAVKKDFTGRDYRNTIVVTARNADRNELNSAIRDELKQQGKLSGKEHTFKVREPKNLSAEEKHFAQSYNVGDRVFAGKAGVIGRAGAEGKVTSVDSENHKITVQTKNGAEHEIDLKSQGQHLSTFQEKEQAFCQGDKVVFLKNDRGLGVKNGQIGEIQSIEKNGTAAIRMENGEIKNINIQTQYNYIDHGYAVTDYKSQGQTSKDVIYHADTSKGVNYNQAYVAATRGKEDLKIYTDSKENLKEQMKHEQSKTSTLDHEKIKSDDTEKSKSESDDRSVSKSDDGGKELSR